MSSETQRAIEALRRWKEKPSVFVREVFHVEPDPWQDDFLDSPEPQQALTACKGPGKTAALAWKGWNRLATRVNCRGLALSITSDNLADNLWTELAKWQQRSPFLQDQFQWTATKIFYKDRPALWWLSARSWPRSGNPQDQANTLAGLHGEAIFILMDEAGGIPRSLLATAQAIMANGTDALLALAGNPTNQDSALGFAVLNQRHMWNVIEVTADPDSPKRTSRVSKEWAKQQIEAWGRDNPWVLVNVFGRFPPSGLNTLLTPDDVRDAQTRFTGGDRLAEAYKQFPLIFGVDVARFGDDESVIFPRRAKIAYMPLRMRNLDTIQGASHVSRMAQERQADSIQIDATGGYGSAWLDGLKSLGHTDALGVQFGGKASEERRFANKRAEIIWNLSEWVKEGGLLPPIPEMVIGLSTMQYTYSRDGRIQIEEKDQIKARLGRSPDLEDALACTFAYPVYTPRRNVFGLPEHLSTLIEKSGHVHDYDPWERLRKEQEKQYG
jgi:phage terminase large subunit